jgi:hypothetical protein
MHDPDVLVPSGGRPIALSLPSRPPGHTYVGATLSPSEGYIIRKNRLAEGQLRYLRIPDELAWSFHRFLPKAV